jgi:hypothetical protein
MVGLDLGYEIDAMGAEKRKQKASTIAAKEAHPSLKADE